MFGDLEKADGIFTMLMDKMFSLSFHILEFNHVNEKDQIEDLL